MQNSQGQNIAGIYGFTKEILSIIRRLAPQYIAVALDTGQKTWRHDLCSDYKANRKKSPVELHHQFQWIRDICNHCNIMTHEKVGYEADDYIASFVYKYKDIADIVIVTYDKDLYQLVEDSVTIYHPFKGTKMGAKEVYEKYQILPTQMADFLALTGDAIDGIVGLKGIGPKTAVNWLAEYGNIENILQNCIHLKPLSKQKIIAEGVQSLKKAKELVSLNKILEVSSLDNNKIRPICGDQITSLVDFVKNIGLQDLIFDFEQTLLGHKALNLTEKLKF